MKIVIPLFLLATNFLFSVSGSAQEENPCRDGKIFYDLEVALQHPEEVLILDLAMQDPKLTSVPPKVGQFPNLVCLDVSFNRISKIPEEITNCTKLRVINLAGNRYLGKFPEVLKDLPNLEEVDFTAIPEWSEEKCQAAKETLPGVTVLTDK